MARSATSSTSPTAIPSPEAANAKEGPNESRTLGAWILLKARKAWVARALASTWMNVLILATAATVFFTVWGGLQHPRSDGRELYEVALKAFALWCLSFLPGWLYIRFLGQRAGALWQEFVIHLHRLGWDQPQFLPEPPQASQYYQEWAGAGGTHHQDHDNIYQKKFEAYYGRSVVRRCREKDYAVRVDSMFPVFLATGILAALWTTVLWEPTFLAAPRTLWDLERFTFLGAYTFVLQSLIRRFFQSDLRASAYASAVLRIIIALLAMTALHQVLMDQPRRLEAVAAFVIGVFPTVALQALTRVAATVLHVLVPQLTPEYPLNQVDGLNVWYESRLLEEGIEDMQNLATANLVDVILHTRVPVGRLVDWVDQSILYLHLDRVERSWSERRRVEPNGDDNAPGKRTKGSASSKARAGTRTRLALRQLGIRSATDLLRAFPPEQADPVCDEPGRRRPVPGSFAHLWPMEDLDEDQVRILLRVLDEEPALAPVWNWQQRGVEAREVSRRPRSDRGATEPAIVTNPAADPPNGMKDGGRPGGS